MALPSTQAPLRDDYAGDEINALVLDPGSHTTRAGFAGEDLPKSVAPTNYGEIDGERVFGDNAIHVPRAGMEIKNPYDADGDVYDVDAAAKLWEWTITSRLTGPSETPPHKNGLNDTKDESGDVVMDDGGVEKPLADFPLLMSESGSLSPKTRARILEIAMEDWGVPAYFVAKSAQLAAYANGKATALVVDVGHRQSSVTAVWEGMVLKKSHFRSPLAGEFINSQIRKLFASLAPPVPIVPYYRVQSKLAVEPGSPAQATYASYDNIRRSFNAQEEDQVLHSFKECVVQVWPGPGRLEHGIEAARHTPPRPFEMPDGYHNVFGLERYQLAEPLFDARAGGDTNINSQDTLPSLVHRALNNCDVETRPTLLSNVVVTGAGSLLDRLPERLQADVQALYPNPRVRVIAPSTSADRKFAPWLGGSILASLGSFHQMWISRDEYNEVGSSIVEKRCK
ncbi:actin-related protein, ARP4 class [Piedraia hortae CBS 480.64]|uniref:Actin-related protein, ARP4 class n=1 Tax=Piedraia hortae CBS 480.64 TaxID=1314780 RepID=A0A6A7C460_9PEZI|nr:actin-related protein, ARP4 class [Piedraia hortae CBS 480.64]